MKKYLLLILAVVLILSAGTLIWLWLGSAPTDTSTETAGQESGIERTDKPPYKDIPDAEPAKAPRPDIEQSLPAVTDVEIPDKPQVSNENDAQKVLSRQQEHLGLGAGSALEITSSSRDEYGNEYYHVEQRYKGLPVRGSQSNLEIEQGHAQVLSGVWVANIELNTEPTYSAAEALRQALDDQGVPADRELTFQGEPELLVFAANDKAHLCWRIQATLSNPVTAPEIYIVDAHQPMILLQQEVFRQ